MFSLYLSDLTQQDRQCIYNTIEAYLTITPHEVIGKLFTSLGSKIINPNENVEYIIDIACLFVPYIDISSVELLYKAIQPYFYSDNHSLQKRSIKLLSTMLSNHRVLVAQNIENILDMLNNTTLKSNSSKVLRLRLIEIIMKDIVDFDQHNKILSQLISEIIIATKENKKQRNLAISILRNEGIYYTTNNNMKMLIQFFLVGLTLDPHVVSCSLNALTIVIIYHEVEQTLFKDLISTSFELLESPHKEVISQALGFLKVLVRKIDLPILLELSQSVVKKLLSFSDENTRFKHTNEIKLVFTKLMRRIDPQEILKFVPGRYKKFVNAIRKLESQNQKKKENSKMVFEKKKKEEDEDEDLEINFNETENTPGTWIIEGKTDDDILDFLGTNANKHISLSNPNKTKKKRKYDETFEVDDTGRMIIEEEKEEEKLETEDSGEQIENPRKKARISKKERSSR